MPLIGQWAVVGDSAFPTNKKLDRFIDIMVTLPNLKLILSDRILGN